MHRDEDLQITMTKRMKRVLAGDVFCFEISPQKYGCVHVLVSDIIQYIVVYEPIVVGEVPIPEIRSMALLLAGWTSDAKIYHGDWLLLGNAPPPSVKFPIYKVGISGETWITDVNGNALRVATSEEAAELPFKSSHSPISYEEAFKAHHGMGPWKSYFDKLLARRP